jgi:hypothetical protein
VPWDWQAGAARSPAGVAAPSPAGLVGIRWRVAVDIPVRGGERGPGVEGGEQAAQEGAQAVARVPGAEAVVVKPLLLGLGAAEIGRGLGHQQRLAEPRAAKDPPKRRHPVLAGVATLEPTLERGEFVGPADQVLLQHAGLAKEVLPVKRVTRRTRCGRDVELEQRAESIDIEDLGHGLIAAEGDVGEARPLRAQVELRRRIAGALFQLAVAVHQPHRGEVGQRQERQGARLPDEPRAVRPVAQDVGARDRNGLRAGEAPGLVPGKGNDGRPGGDPNDRAQQVEHARLVGCEQRLRGLGAQPDPVGQVVAQDEQRGLHRATLAFAAKARGENLPVQVEHRGRAGRWPGAPGSAPPKSRATCPASAAQSARGCAR